MKRILSTIMFLLLLSPAEAAYLDLAWDPNAEPDLDGYRVYYGTGSRAYTQSIDVGDTTAYRLDGLLDGVTYYIAVTAYDTSDNESDYSNEVFGVGVTVVDPDSDGDGLLDEWEIEHFGSLDQGPGDDYDGDGLNNLGEYQQGTDPTDPDTDSDGMADGWEIQYGLDPLDGSDASVDSDGDGVTNLEEYLAGSDPTSVPPTADAGPDQTVDEGATVTLDGSDSSDPDDGIASYLWEQTGGIPVPLSDSTAVRPTFTSPDVGPDGTSLAFRLTVTDNAGQPSTDICHVYVNWVNAPPTADAGPNQTVDEGVTVTLDGSNSSDPDDGIASYLWEQTDGIPVTLSDPEAVRPTFISPDVGADGVSLTFRLTATDEGGLQSTDSCVVNVTWVNIPPTADAGPDQTVDEGVTVTLDGSNSSDPDDGIASYLWEQTSGIPVTLWDHETVQPSFIAPNVGPGGVSLTFQLTVTDGGGLRSTDSCVVNITWVNVPPTADAGPDQMVDEGVTVTLNGSNSSDPDDGIASYLWEQTDGVPVTLSDPRAVQPSFVSPDVGPLASLTFQLTVTDNGGLRSTDTCIVNVTRVGLPPVADAGPDQTVDEGVTVTLDGSDSSDPDDGIASYLWEQTDGIPVTLSDSMAVQPSFAAPNVEPSGDSLWFRLTVTDHGGLQSTDSCLVNVTWVNAPPRADAGSDQTVDEGTTVALDGSGSSDPDDGIASYLWTQVSGISVTLSDPTAVDPTFVTPPVDASGAVLSFRLTVRDRGGLQNSNRVYVTVNDNGITGFPADVITTMSSTGRSFGIKVESGGSCISLYPVDPSTIQDTRNRPEDLLYGLIDTKFRTDSVGGTVLVRYFLGTPAPEGYRWFKYSPAVGGYDYSDHVGFNSARDQVIVTLVDGGAGDDDGVVNGMIEDPSVLGKASTGGSTVAAAPHSDEKKLTGCFISTVSRSRGRD